MDDFILFVYKLDLGLLPGCFISYLPPLISAKDVAFAYYAPPLFAALQPPLGSLLGVCLGNHQALCVHPGYLKFQTGRFSKSWDTLFNDKSSNSTWDVWWICIIHLYLYFSCLQTIVKNRIRLPTQIPAKIVPPSPGKTADSQVFPQWALSTNAGTHVSFLSGFERIPLESSLFNGLMDLMNVDLRRKSKTKQGVAGLAGCSMDSLL